MSREIVLDCPSGLVVKIRGVKGKDLDGLRDRRKLSNGEAITKLLDDCTLEVLNRSIYEKLTHFTWADMLVGDRLFALIGSRQVTAGPTYDFRVRCQDKECRKMIDWTIELPDLPIKPLSKESAERFLAGNVFETTLGDKLIKYSLPTGRSQTKLVKYMQQLEQKARQKDDDANGAQKEGQVLVALAGKIISIDGVSNVLNWLGDQELEDITNLRHAMEKPDCGVETGIHVECEQCQLEQEIDLPLDHRFFQTSPS